MGKRTSLPAEARDAWPPIVSGAVGALVAVLVNAPVWFLGIRWLTGDVPKEEAE